MYQSNARESGPPLTPSAWRDRVWHFLSRDAGFAQVVTINKSSQPVGRTMVAPVDPDWSVPLVQRKVHHRIDQWHANPSTEVIWTGPPHRDNRNLAPHVHDLCVQVPRVVFLRGTAKFMDDGEVVAAYRRQLENSRVAGRTLAPERDDDAVLHELVGVRIVPRQVRAEGFGSGPESYTWKLP